MEDTCGAITFSLESPYKILEMDKEALLLLLRPKADQEPSILDAAYVKLKLNAVTWQLPIKVTFTACVVESIKFTSSSISIDHVVGSE